MIVVLFVAAVAVIFAGAYCWKVGLHFHAEVDWVLAVICLVLAWLRYRRSVSHRRHETEEGFVFVADIVGGGKLYIKPSREE